MSYNWKSRQVNYLLFIALCLFAGLTACKEDDSLYPAIEVPEVEVKEEEEVEEEEPYDPRDSIIGNYIGTARYYKIDSSNIEIILIDTILPDTVTITKHEEEHLISLKSTLPFYYEAENEGEIFSYSEAYYSENVPGLQIYSYARDIYYRPDDTQNEDLRIEDSYYTRSDTSYIVIDYTFEGSRE